MFSKKLFSIILKLLSYDDHNERFYEKFIFLMEINKMTNGENPSVITPRLNVTTQSNFNQL